MKVHVLAFCLFNLEIYICLAQQTIFEDNFDGDGSLDETKWKFEQTLSGGYDWQFQWFVNDPENAFRENGILHIRPTLTAEKFGEEELYKKKVEIDKNDCTSAHNYGCSRVGTKLHILNPIRSASIQTKQAFKYGNFEIKVKLPFGDWLRPSIKLLPKENFYGPWPKSGEIDFIESRGNENLFNDDEEAIGVQRVATTAHFGPRYDINGWENAHFIKNIDEGFHRNFHVFNFDWSENGMKFLIDGEEIGNFSVKENKNFWNFGEFDADGHNLPNPWTHGTPMAPFDQEFYILISLAVGGVSDFFSDNFEDRGHGKPWPNSSQKAPLLFWRAKDKWYKTWTATQDAADFQIDYVRVLSK